MAPLDGGRDNRKNRPVDENDETPNDKTFSLHDLTNEDKPHELFISEMQHIIFQNGMDYILETIN